MREINRDYLKIVQLENKWVVGIHDKLSSEICKEFTYIAIAADEDKEKALSQALENLGQSHAALSRLYCRISSIYENLEKGFDVETVDAYEHYCENKKIKYNINAFSINELGQVTPSCI